jgi:hypothetical protein
LGIIRPEANENIFAGLRKEASAACGPAATFLTVQSIAQLTLEEERIIMTDETLADADVVEAETEKEMVLVGGKTLDMWSELATTFSAELDADMPIEQRRDAVRTVLVGSTQADEKLALVQGELLYEARENGYWKDWTFTDEEGEDRSFGSFEEFCLNEMGMKKRKAYYLIEIYQKFVVDLDLPKDVLKDLQWSKAKALCKVIDEDNWSDLLDKIGSMSLRQVEEMVKAMKSGEGASGSRSIADKEPSEEMVRINFKLHPDQAENVRAALDVAESMVGSDKKPSHALDLICSDFMAGVAGTGLEGSLTKLDAIVKNIERAFGVELDVKGVDEDRYGGLKEGEAATEEVTA